MQTNIKIGLRIVGAGHAPFIIAEMSGNHNQSLERALEIVEAAAKKRSLTRLKYRHIRRIP